MLEITPRACWFLRSMIVSCGSVGCFETIRLLESVTEDIPFEHVAIIDGYSYRLKAFERLEKYAEMNNIKKIELEDVVKYFGGRFHIEIMSEFAGHAGLARYLGEAAGLVTHILLPLDSEVYENCGKKIKITNAFKLNPHEKGIPCFHLGLIVNVPISEEVVQEIKKQQSESKIFTEYLKEIPEEITIPKEYFTALNCLANK